MKSLEDIIRMEIRNVDPGYKKETKNFLQDIYANLKGKLEERRQKKSQRQVDLMVEDTLNELLPGWANKESEDSVDLGSHVEEARSLYVKGHSFVYSGKVDEGINLYLKAIELDTLNYFLHYALGCAYQVKGDHKRSLSEFKVAASLNPEFGLAYYGAGTAYTYLGKWKKSLEWYKKGLPHITDDHKRELEHQINCVERYLNGIY